MTAAAVAVGICMLAQTRKLNHTLLRAFNPEKPQQQDSKLNDMLTHWRS